jgi:hypothetical protein
MALGYMLVGTLLGSLLLLQKVIPLPGGIGEVRPIHIEFLLVGFMIQLAMGVALWILPRNKELPRSRLPWVVGLLLNLGVLVVSVGGRVFDPGTTMFIGRLLEVGAVVLCARLAWPRIRAFRG